MEGELEYDGTQEDFFVPNRKAKHHVPKTFSDTNPKQKKVNKNKAKKRKRESSDENSSEDDPEINMGIERVPYEKEQQHMRSNPLYLHQSVEGFGFALDVKYYSLIRSTSNHMIWCSESR